MAARDEILRRVRQHAPSPTPRPHFTAARSRYEDRRARFCESLQAVGGRAIVAADWQDVVACLQQVPELAASRPRLCAVSRLQEDPFWSASWADYPTEQSLDGVGVVCAAGELAVAENGAIWITEQAVPIRAALFLAEHLVLVVPAARIVDTLHDAYEQIPVGEHREFGCFISGPSKTADIEQSLVIGAQGARSLTAVLVERF